MRQVLKRRACALGVCAVNSGRRRVFGAIVAALVVGMGVFASAAAADEPVITQYPVADTAVVTDVCDFPITVDFNAIVRETDFFVNGTLTRVLIHLDEQDTLTANGNTLTGVPFTANVILLFDSSGNLTSGIGQGIVEKVVLPDGSLFITAGRVDFLARGVTFALTPSTGATVNLAGFCAALSP
jgi:hypothetical protein